MAGYRQQRVSDFIQEQLAELLRREVQDPRIDQVTITAVDVSPDLKQARVYFSLMGDELAIKETQKGLEHATGFLRRQLAGRLQLRVVPTLSFHFDKSLATGSRIEELLHQIEEEAGEPLGTNGDETEELLETEDDEADESFEDEDDETDDLFEDEDDDEVDELFEDEIDELYETEEEEPEE